MKGYTKVLFTCVFLTTSSPAQFCELIKDSAIISSSGLFGTIYTEIFYNTISNSKTESKSILNLNVVIQGGANVRDLHFRLTMDSLYRRTLDSTLPIPIGLAAYNLLSDSSNSPPIIYPSTRKTNKRVKPIAVLSANKNAKALIHRSDAEFLGLEFSEIEQISIAGDKLVPVKVPVINPYELIKYLHNPISCDITKIQSEIAPNRKYNKKPGFDLNGRILDNTTMPTPGTQYFQVYRFQN